MTKIQNSKRKLKGLEFGTLNLFRFSGLGFRVLILCILIFAFFIFNKADAAILYLDPASGEHSEGDTFIINIRLDPEKECINAVQVELEFTKDVLEVKDVSKGSSIISFWVKGPEFSNEMGFISFTGGIPGGFCGILPGDPGKSNLLGKIIFKVVGESFSDNAKIEFLDTSQVLLNDGLGTPALLSTRGSIVKITGVEPRQIPRDEWQEELEKDKTPPEPFEIEINQEPSIFDGKYFIIFNTADKQTGIDYYEVKEGKGEWRKAVSPYLLEDQSLEGIIKVRAVDKAGNERIAEYEPANVFLYWIIILILILIGAGIIWWTIRKLKMRS